MTKAVRTSLPMPPPLAYDFQIEIERAHEQLHAFYNEVRAYISSGAQDISTKLNPKGNGEYEVIITLVIHRPIPYHIGVLAGEVVQHARNSLDHLVYQLSVPRPKKTNYLAKLNQVAFPVFQDSNYFSQKRRRDRRIPVPNSGLYKISLVQPGGKAVIKSLQPYQAGKNASLHPLWILEQLSNIYKHRRLHMLANARGFGGLVKDHFGPYDVLDFQDFSGRPAKDGAILSRVRIRDLPGFERKVRVRANFPGEVSFDEGIALPQRYAGEILQDILSFIYTKVIPPLEPYLN